jgi:hypothetical protein
MGNYGGDSSGIQRVLLVLNQFGTSGSIPSFGMANGNYSTASFGVSHPFTVGVPEFLCVIHDVDHFPN